MVSVIMPCYRNRDTVADSIQSLQAQTIPQWELIAVDDGSPEHDYERIMPYALEDERIRVICKENGGVSSARNAGMKEARGEWLFFLDADDLLKENALEILLSLISPDIDITCGAYEMLWDDGRTEYCGCRTGTLHEIRDSLIRGDSALNSMCARLYRTEMIRKYRLETPEGIAIGEDVHFNLEAFRCAREFMFTERSIYIYRRNENSAMANAERGRFEKSLPMIFGIGEHLSRNHLSTEHFRAHLDIWLRTLRADRGRLRAALSFSPEMVREICRGVEPEQLQKKERLYYTVLRMCPFSSVLIP